MTRARDKGLRRRKIPGSGGTWFPPGFGASVKLWLIAGSQYYDLGAGGDILRWHDQSGFDNDVEQTTTAKQPTPETAGLNSRPSVLFVKANSDHLISDGTTADDVAKVPDGTDQPYEVALVATIVTATNNGTMFGWGDSASANPNLQHLHPNTITDKHRLFRRDNAGGVIDVSTTETADTSPHRFHWRFTGTAVTLWIDGVLTSLNGTAADVGAVTFNRFTLGAGRLNAGEINPWDGRISEYIVRTGNWTEAERLAIDAQFVSRWGF